MYILSEWTPGGGLKEFLIRLLFHCIFRLALRYNLSVMTFYEDKTGRYRPLHEYQAFKQSPPIDFNFVMEHIFYNRDELNRLLHGNNDSYIFISTLRHPLAQLKSDLHYKGLDNSGHMKHFESPLDKILMSSDISKTGQKYLSIPREYSGNNNKMQEYLEKLDGDFVLILITEYYDLSLVLLRRLLCWDLQDILYSTLKKGKYSYHSHAISEKRVSVQFLHVLLDVNLCIDGTCKKTRDPCTNSE